MKSLLARAADKSRARSAVARLTALFGKLKRAARDHDDDDDLPGPNATVAVRPLRYVPALALLA